MQAIFRRESSENNVPSQAVHFNPETSEVVLPEPNVKQKLSRKTILVLFIRDSKWGGVPFALLYGLYTLQTVNHVTEGNLQVTTRAVTWWLPGKVGEMV